MFFPPCVARDLFHFQDHSGPGNFVYEFLDPRWTCRQFFVTSHVQSLLCKAHDPVVVMPTATAPMCCLLPPISSAVGERESKLLSTTVQITYVFRNGGTIENNLASPTAAVVPFRLSTRIARDPNHLKGEDDGRKFPDHYYIIHVPLRYHEGEQDAKEIAFSTT